MLKKTVTYEDLNGQQVTEDFYFHLSKAELLQMELSEKEGLAQALRKIVESKDGAGIVDRFKQIILAAYGQKSEDGRRFIKTPELRDAFEQHVAFSELFIEFATNAQSAAEFIRGIVPVDVADGDFQKNLTELQEQAKPEETPEAATSEEPMPERPVDSYSRQELLEMSSEEFQRLAGSDVKNMPRELLEVAMQRKNQHL